MKIRLALAACLTLSAVSLPALAHDPKLHMKAGSTAPDCAKMHDMDMSKMDMNDPVMKAMHAKCMDHSKHDSKAGGAPAQTKAEAKHDATKPDGHDHRMGDMPGMDMGAKSSADKVTK